MSSLDACIDHSINALVQVVSFTFYAVGLCVVAFVGLQFR